MLRSSAINLMANPSHWEHKHFKTIIQNYALIIQYNDIKSLKENAKV